MPMYLVNADIRSAADIEPFDYSVLEQSVDAIIEALVLPEYRQRYEIIDEDTPP